MTRTRRVLGPIAALWLMSQAATLTLAPALLEASLADCACPHGGNAALCPMHHRTATAFKVCSMQRVVTDTAATLNALFSVVGQLPTRRLEAAPVSNGEPLCFVRTSATLRPSPPDPPPPRL